MLYMRLNTSNMDENATKNLHKLVRVFQRRNDGVFIYISLDDFGKMEKELTFKPHKYSKLIVDVYEHPSGQLQLGGEIATANYNLLLSKLPREDNFYKEGVLDIQ